MYRMYGMPQPHECAGAVSPLFFSIPCEYQSPYCILAPLITGKITIYIWISITTPQV
ncbi:MAG: hypothetical protein ACI9ZT_001668 [Gammaproteobacteria bacterium]|jgi:hypothetical protein